MTGAPLVLLGALVVLGIALAALLSAGEVAVMRVTRAQVTELVAAHHPAAPQVQRLVAHPSRVASAAAFVRLLGEMTATVSVTLAASELVRPWWAVLLTSFGVCVVMALVLVRVSPRTVGRRRPVATLTALAGLLSAVTAAFGGLGRAAAAGRTTAEEDENELRDMVQRVAESEVIEDTERAMFRSVLQLGDTLTREVMVPRTDMVVTHEDTPVRKALALLMRSGFSRVPVIGESVDDVRGVLYLKDVVSRLAPDRPRDAAELDVPVGALVRPAVFVPESKPVDDLLRELRDGASHMAMVVDEYGGIAGLVTIEDALEEIVGELTDEHDRTAPTVQDLGDGVFRVPARMGRDELGELFGLEVEDEDVDTAGGLLAKALGMVPLPGSAGDIHGLHLVADRAEGRRRRLATVLVSRSVEGQVGEGAENPGGAEVER